MAARGSKDDKIITIVLTPPESVPALDLKGQGSSLVKVKTQAKLKSEANLKDTASNKSDVSAKHVASTSTAIRKAPSWKRYHCCKCGDLSYFKTLPGIFKVAQLIFATISMVCSFLAVNPKTYYTQKEWGDATKCLKTLTRDDPMCRYTRPATCYGVCLSIAGFTDPLLTSTKIAIWSAFAVLAWILTVALICKLCHDQEFASDQKLLLLFYYIFLMILVEISCGVGLHNHMYYLLKYSLLLPKSLWVFGGTISGEMFVVSCALSFQWNLVYKLP